MPTEPLAVVIVTLKTDTTIRGVLREVGENGFILAAAQIAGEVPNTNNVAWRSLPGEVVIPLNNVDYWQRSLPPELLGRLEV
jgi:hypothetical protein